MIPILTNTSKHPANRKFHGFPGKAGSVQTRTILLFLVILTGLPRGMPAQEISPQRLNRWEERKEFFERKYGINADLLNGLKYRYPYAAAEGSPFLFEGEPVADICIKGNVFLDQLVKYDIHNHKLVLEYTDLYGAESSIVLRKEWVDWFRYGEMRFGKFSGAGTKERFYQVVYEGNLSCLYAWERDLKLDSGTGSKQYIFTDPGRTGYLVDGNRFHRFQNRWSFLRFFDNPERREIREYIRSHRIRIRKAPDREMHALMNYCNQVRNDEK